MKCKTSSVVSELDIYQISKKKADMDTEHLLFVFSLLDDLTSK